MDPSRYWVGVVSKDHLFLGLEGGFIQLNHGKRAPLQKMRAGDWLAIYSPRLSLETKDPYQRFTALGRIKTGEIVQVEMANGFMPYRLEVAYLDASEAPIQPLIERLSFIKDKRNWGYVFRYGHLQIPREDFELIAHEMGVNL